MFTAVEAHLADKRDCALELLLPSHLRFGSGKPDDTSHMLWREVNHQLAKPTCW